jgi:hypothetical protein
MDAGDAETILGAILDEPRLARRPATLWRRQRVSIMAVTAMLVAAVAAAAWLTTSLGGALNSPSAAAAQVLRRAANAAGAEASPRLAAGEFYFMRSIATFSSPSSGIPLRHSAAPKRSGRPRRA